MDITGKYINVILCSKFKYAIIEIYHLLAARIYVGLTPVDFWDHGSVTCASNITTRYLTTLIHCVQMVTGRFITIFQHGPDRRMQLCDLRIFADGNFTKMNVVVLMF